MTGECRTDGNVHGFIVADFAYEDHVGVLAQDGAQTSCKGESTLWVHWDLVDSIEFILNRIFDGDDLLARVVQLIQARVQRGGLATSGWPGDQHHAVRLLNHAIHDFPHLVAHAQADQVERQRALIQNTHDHALTVDGGNGTHADINLAAFKAQRDVAILWHIALSDVHVGHDLDAAQQRRLQMLGRRWLFDEHAVDAVLDLEFRFKRLNVNVRSPILNRFKNDQVDQVDERWLLGHPVHIISLNGIKVVINLSAANAAVFGKALGHACSSGSVHGSHQFAEQAAIKSNA